MRHPTSKTTAERVRAWYLEGEQKILGADFDLLPVNPAAPLPRAHWTTDLTSRRSAHYFSTRVRLHQTPRQRWLPNLDCRTQTDGSVRPPYSLRSSASTWQWCVVRQEAS